MTRPVSAGRVGAKVVLSGTELSSGIGTHTRSQAPRRSIQHGCTGAITRRGGSCGWLLRGGGARDLGQDGPTTHGDEHVNVEDARGEQGDGEVADEVAARFRPELRVAFDDSLARSDDEVPAGTPFVLATYRSACPTERRLPQTRLSRPDARR